MPCGCEGLSEVGIASGDKKVDLRWAECWHRTIDRSTDAPMQEPLLDQKKPNCVGETTRRRYGQLV